MSDTTLGEAFAACGTVLLGLFSLVCLRFIFMVCFELIFFDRYYNDPPWFLRTFFPRFVSRRASNTNSTGMYNEQVILRQLDQQNDGISLSELLLRINQVLPVGDTNDMPNQNLVNDIIEQLIPGTLVTEDSIIEIQKMIIHSKTVSAVEQVTNDTKVIISDQQLTDTQALDQIENKEVMPIRNISSVEEQEIQQQQKNQRQQQIHDNLPQCIPCSDDSFDDIEKGLSYNSPTGLPLCSICIHDVQAGEMVYVAETCHHVFHVECIRGWVAKVQEQNFPAYTSSNEHSNNNNTNDNNNNHSTAIPATRRTEIKINNDCPNCRTPILIDVKERLRSIIRKCNESSNNNTNANRDLVGTNNYTHSSSPDINTSNVVDEEVIP